jgi:hypothetical protein
MLIAQVTDCKVEFEYNKCWVREKPSTWSVIFNITASYDGPREGNMFLCMNQCVHQFSRMSLTKVWWLR